MTAEWDEYRYHMARPWLESVRSLGERVRSTQALIEDERAMMDGVSAIDPSRESSGTASDDAMVNAIARITEHISDFAALLAEYEEERFDARRRLSMMEDGSERAALTYYYLLGWTWERTCVEMHYSYDGMMKLRRRAIIHAFDVMPRRDY